MSEGMQDLARRLVLRRKSDGRGVYDEAAKAELVAACAKPGVSMSRLARECGVNANQLSRWVREAGERRQRGVAAPALREVFVAVPIEAAGVKPRAMQGNQARALGQERSTRLGLRVHLPNGVEIEMCECELRQLGEVLEALGRARCFASTQR